MPDTLHIALEAVKKGSEKANLYFGRNPKVTIKPDNSPVTIADKEAEEAIKSYILSQLPNAQFLGEESGGNMEADDCWIIDPIDGTKNFMRGIPLWAVLLAHYTNGICDVGVSYIPMLNDMCYAERGKGAFLNGEQIHVSQITKLSDAYFSHGESRYFTNTASLLDLSNQVLTQRAHGDATTYNNLAAGKIDIVVDARNHAWDAAPFTVIIEEAGGKVSNLKGEPWNIHDLDFVATNGLLHEQVIEILAQKQ